MSKKTRKPTGHNQAVASKNRQLTHTSQTFIEHVRELRRRLYCVALSVLIWGAVAYGFEKHIVNLLLRPARGEHFIYTSPGGGIDFLFRICIYAGIVASLPVILYNLLRFIEPLITSASNRFIVGVSLISGILAGGGMLFGYYIGLPSAIHFLLHQFTTVQIEPLVTIQSYLSFVIVYMVGSAVLFQLPLLLICINRIKPLKPSRLFHYERWVILAAFVLAGLMNPSPNILSQLLIAGPFIIMYQIGIGIIALVNRGDRREAVIPEAPEFQPIANVVASPQVLATPSPLPAPARSVRYMEPVMRRPVRSGPAMLYAPKPRQRSRHELYAMRNQSRQAFHDVQPVFRRPNIISLDAAQS